MTTANSPHYQLGRVDGEADAQAASRCPPAPIIGPNPPMPEFPLMYMRGYWDAFVPVPCGHEGH